MRKILSAILFLFVTFSANAQWDYPSTKIVDSANNYFGQIITDHYRWMKNMDDSSVQSWFKKQGEYSKSILKKISGRDSLFDHFVTLSPPWCEYMNLYSQIIHLLRICNFILAEFSQ